MKIPQQVKEVAEPYGNYISYLGEYEGEQVFQVCMLNKQGVSLETGMPVLVFFSNDKARLEISDKNLSVIMTLSEL